MRLVKRADLPAIWKKLESDRVERVHEEVEAIAALFRREKKAVLAAYPDRTAVLTVIKGQGPRWRATLQALWSRMGQRYGNTLLTQLSQKGWNPKRFLHTAFGAARRSANAIVASTKRKVGHLMEEMGEKAEEGLEALYDGWEKVRSHFIADQEVRGAIGAAEEEAAIQTRRPLRKTWISMRDGLVRDTHVEYDGTSKGLQGEWAEGLRYPRCPDADIKEIANCRCQLVYSS